MGVVDPGERAPNNVFIVMHPWSSTSRTGASIASYCGCAGQPRAFVEAWSVAAPTERESRIAAVCKWRSGGGGGPEASKIVQKFAGNVRKSKCVEVLPLKCMCHRKRACLPSATLGGNGSGLRGCRCTACPLVGGPMPHPHETHDLRAQQNTIGQTQHSVFLCRPNHGQTKEPKGTAVDKGTKCKLRPRQSRDPDAYATYATLPIPLSSIQRSDTFSSTKTLHCMRNVCNIVPCNQNSAENYENRGAQNFPIFPLRRCWVPPSPSLPP